MNPAMQAMVTRKACRKAEEEMFKLFQKILGSRLWCSTNSLCVWLSRLLPAAGPPSPGGGQAPALHARTQAVALQAGRAGEGDCAERYAGANAAGRLADAVGTARGANKHRRLWWSAQASKESDNKQDDYGAERGDPG